MDKDYLTIQEVATRANKSPQAIYQRLNSSLKPYLKVINGKKMLHPDALEVLEPKEDLSKSDEALNKVIEILQDQLRVKDDQIKALNESLQKALQATSESHFIQAQEQQKALIEPASEVKRPWYHFFKR